ncbi:putative zinc-binding alcohol dehydrogenase [Mycolicibacterium madagascariense]|uniref:Putative zinc-binding alcohol dehydrogenase n=1 Tax=Mycolicibacterium madagascariense TaxID=212765 RepID=A0A7I7XMF6_9MYCO|nr:zinc-binding alcohol dehydrogenase family protein [Mycolicibacterium madagascariense]MCV7013079.1 zinc-binding alcohol dehydrogenase family protein [Mycolicibacterium madagascariense]BBZ30386.1 putative zinc-binding alcohol dehydrogenase [Mycolicibacterium madagascariense]
MKAAIVERWGQVPVYGDFAEPTARDGAVIATVEASALTNLTRALMSGKHYASKEIALPAIPGVDGVARLEDGRRFYTGGIGSYGLMAERAAMHPAGAIELPDHVDSVTAAAVPNPGMSAWMALDYGAAITPGAHVLVIGATGVTGSMAAQLAKSMFGAGKVVVTGRDTARLDWLRTVGADDAIAMTTEDLGARVAALHAERPFDAVLDYLWGASAETVLAALADSHPAAHFHATRFVQIGSMTGQDITLPAGILRGNGITLSGIGIGSVPPEVVGRARTEALPALFDMVADGTLQLRTQARPLAEVAEAWTAAEPSGTRVVLTP